MTDRMARGGARVLLAAAFLLLAACDPGRVSLVDLSGRTDATDTLYVTVLRPDSTPAAGAEIGYVGVETAVYEFHSTEVDAEGRAALTGLVGSKLYWVGAEQEDAGVGMLGGGEKVVAPSGGSKELEIVLGEPRRSGVVISEIYMNEPPVWELGNNYYPYSTYLELANISEETVYLDGMLLAQAYHWYWDSGQYGHHFCADTEVMRVDPEGVWSLFVWQIPGAGSDYPLMPGEAAVLAASAADHTSVHPTMLDLSDADFEFRLAGIADNPAAPNLIALGPQSIQGTSFNLYAQFWVLARPADVNTFPEVDDPGGTGPAPARPHVRVPREKIEDVVFMWWDPSESTVVDAKDMCFDPVHPDFDRLPGGFQLSSEEEVSAQRRPVTVEGRSILLDTNTSWVDLMKAPRTPGWLP